ncbi:cytochrome c biogenesis protein CcdA [Thermodesulforhabdus norvegica]|uniref:Thiol:disulfide interchange protein DsbD n=1 Tax=Thermodesulforhabdus norvegica TaxID=39841 RepID=A0A1I4RIT0_9BACT|nr:cytochrome c biogenesis protein CcdA [Thermodesulforhabdus norvegica]SFM51956.1 thiol:disulfide interchange protein DsbD [Thermodesulforhabdus norvegica]
MSSSWIVEFREWMVGQSLLAFIAAFWGGVLASFTPCTYPVLPITVAYIGHQASRDKRRVLFYSALYATGLAVTYTTLGIVATLTGKLFGSWVGNRWLYLVVGNICILAALIMLEVFHVRPPSWLRNLGRSKNSWGGLGAFSMGVTSALIIGPCTTPILGVLLSMAAAKQNLPWTISVFLAFSYGLAFIVVIAGIFAGLLTALPSSGPWLRFIQKALAMCMFAVGEYFIFKAGTLS